MVRKLEASAHRTFNRVAMCAARSAGIVSRGDLVEQGISAGKIEHQLEMCHIRGVHHAVYSVGPTALSEEAIWLAATRIGPTGAVLSFRSAGQLYGLCSWHGPVEITRTFGGRSGLRAAKAPGVPNVLAHRTRSLPFEDCVIVRGIPVTSPARTLIDLASVLSFRSIERAVFQAMRRNVIEREPFHRRLSEGSQGRKGIKMLEQIVASMEPNVARTRSDAEAWLLGVIADAGLPLPRVNSIVEGMEVDFCWPDKRVCVEFDGREHHGDPEAFEKDRRRDRKLTLAGYSVLRFTYRDLKTDPDRVAREIREALAQA